jgi:ADP-ribosylglycohydrolase
MRAGQPSADVEGALALARSLVARGSYTVEAAADGEDSRPAGSAAGALVRSIPLALLAHATGAREEDDAAAGALIAALSHAVGRGGGPEPAHQAAVEWARGAGAPAPVKDALGRAASSAGGHDDRSRSPALASLQDAFFTLLHSDGFESGVAATVGRGGDNATNAAIAGALLGAVHGRPSIPERWRSLVLSCRPHPLRTRHPRPRAYWPTDVLELAERLILVGMKAAAASPHSMG